MVTLAPQSTSCCVSASAAPPHPPFQLSTWRNHSSVHLCSDEEEQLPVCSPVSGCAQLQGHKHLLTVNALKRIRCLAWHVPKERWRKGRGGGGSCVTSHAGIFQLIFRAASTRSNILMFVYIFNHCFCLGKTCFCTTWRL